MLLPNTTGSTTWSTRVFFSHLLGPERIQIQSSHSKDRCSISWTCSHNMPQQRSEDRITGSEGLVSGFARVTDNGRVSNRRSHKERISRSHKTGCRTNGGSRSAPVTSTAPGWDQTHHPGLVTGFVAFVGSDDVDFCLVKLHRDLATMPVLSFPTFCPSYTANPRFWLQSLNLSTPSFV